MNDQEVYTAILNKVIKNGWKPGEGLPENYTWKYEGGSFWVKAPMWDEKEEKIIDMINACSIEKILFDHRFALFLWGDKDWKNNIKELAISEDRAGYLSQFIDEKLSPDKAVVDFKLD